VFGGGTSLLRIAPFALSIGLAFLISASSAGYDEPYGSLSDYYWIFANLLLFTNVILGSVAWLIHTSLRGTRLAESTWVRVITAGAVIVGVLGVLQAPFVLIQRLASPSLNVEEDIPRFTGFIGGVIQLTAGETAAGFLLIANLLLGFAVYGIAIYSTWMDSSCGDHNA
jgi:hypothetical protein